MHNLLFGMYDMILIMHVALGICAYRILEGIIILIWKRTFGGTTWEM